MTSARAHDPAYNRPSPLARGAELDLVVGPIGWTLLCFAVPTLLANLLQTVSNSVNAVWIARFLGEQALAATTNASLTMFVMVAAVFGFGLAAMIMIGQNIGRGDTDGARRVFGSALGLYVIISTVVLVGGWWAAPGLLRLLATPAGVYSLALIYLRVMFLALPPGLLSGLLTVSLRAAGDAKTPVRFMALGVAVDMALNPVLILGLGPAPRLGIVGAAVATFLGNTVAFVALAAHVYAKDLPIRLRGAEWRYVIPDKTLSRALIFKGSTMGLQMLIASASALLLVTLVNRHGAAATAAYGAASQLWAYIQMPAVAIAAAVSAMVAQNIGAGRWDRVGKVARAGLVISLVITGAVVAVAVAFQRPALGLFLSAYPQTEALAARINLIAAWSFIPFGAALVLSAAPRGNGATLAPLIILLIAMIPVRFGFARAFEPVMGATAIWWSLPAGALALLALTTAYYRRGRWRRPLLPSPKH